MRAEQVGLSVLRWINGKPRLAPVLDRVLAPFNQFDPAMNVDPYPAYERLRADGPVLRNRALKVWVVSSYDLCEQVLRSSASVERGDLFDVVPPWSKLGTAHREVFTRSMLLLDPPDHTRLRRLVSRAFTPRTIERIEPRIQEIAEGLVRAAAAEDRVDLHEAVFAPFPIYVIGELLGIPREDWDRLKAWSDEGAKIIDPIDAFDPLVMGRMLGELTEALDRWIDLRRAQPGDDLLSQLVQVEVDGDQLDRTELRSMIALLMIAGHETTSGLLGNAVVALEDRPDLRARLAEDPDGAGPAVEELLRFDAPVQNTGRTVVEPLDLAGHTARPGEVVTLLLGAANRDPQRFEDPNRLDFDRPDCRPLSFGHGIHHCLGAALARAEARTVLPLLYQHLPHHRVDTAALRWKRSMTLRGPVALPVRR